MERHAYITSHSMPHPPFPSAYLNHFTPIGMHPFQAYGACKGGGGGADRPPRPPLPPRPPAPPPSYRPRAGMRPLTCGCMTGMPYSMPSIPGRGPIMLCAMAMVMGTGIPPGRAIITMGCPWYGMA